MAANEESGTPGLTIIESGITNTTFESGVTVVQPTVVYGAHLGEDCFVGPFTEIQTGAVVGKRSRVQSHACVTANVRIGDDCFIGHGAKFASSSLAILAPEHDVSGNACVLGDNVLVGTNATIFPVSICSDVVIGAGAVVVSDITVPGKYVGSPARLIQRNDNKA